VRNTLRAAASALVIAGALLGPAASACPSCAATSSPKERSVWPIVGAFMLVPWALAGGAVLLIRRESRSA
jgi:hypothetical protein